MKWRICVHWFQAWFSIRFQYGDFWPTTELKYFPVHLLNITKLQICSIFLPNVFILIGLAYDRSFGNWSQWMNCSEDSAFTSQSQKSWSNPFISKIKYSLQQTWIQTSSSIYDRQITLLLTNTYIHTTVLT